MRPVPFVFALFPVYGLKEVEKIITYNKRRIIFLLVRQKFRSCLH